MSDEEGAVLWIVYMLECADKTLYTGITNNLDRRMAEHGVGKGAKYTKGRGPFRLVYSETCQGRAEASRRETAIKAWTGHTSFSCARRQARDGCIEGKAS
jgi:putative endonuclease